MIDELKLDIKDPKIRIVYNKIIKRLEKDYDKVMFDKRIYKRTDRRKSKDIDLPKNIDIVSRDLNNPYDDNSYNDDYFDSFTHYIVNIIDYYIFKFFF